MVKFSVFNSVLVYPFEKRSNAPIRLILGTTLEPALNDLAISMLSQLKCARFYNLRTIVV